jgi:hypothetical protein
MRPKICFDSIQTFLRGSHGFDLSRLQVHLGAWLHLSLLMGKTEYKSGGSEPQPPQGSWQESNVNSLHGRELVRLIQSGQVTVSVVVCLPFAV